jgi:hypothetical protein
MSAAGLSAAGSRAWRELPLRLAGVVEGRIGPCSAASAAPLLMNLAQRRQGAKMSWLTGGEGWQGAMSLLAHAESCRPRPEAQRGRRRAVAPVVGRARGASMSAAGLSAAVSRAWRELPLRLAGRGGGADRSRTARVSGTLALGDASKGRFGSRTCRVSGTLALGDGWKGQFGSRTAGVSGTLALGDASKGRFGSRTCRVSGTLALGDGWKGQFGSRTAGVSGTLALGDAVAGVVPVPVPVPDRGLLGSQRRSAPDEPRAKTPRRQGAKERRCRG